MNAMKIAREVGKEYGLTVEQLDGGAFPPHQFKVLGPMLEQAMRTHTEMDWRKYLIQKAKFIKNGRT